MTVQGLKGDLSCSDAKSSLSPSDLHPCWTDKSPATAQQWANISDVVLSLDHCTMIPSLRETAYMMTEWTGVDKSWHRHDGFD